MTILFLFFMTIFGVIITFFLPVRSKVGKDIKLILVIGSIGLFLGVIVRAIMLQLNFAEAFGPVGDYSPDASLMAEALSIISLYQLAVLLGVIFIIFPRFVIYKKYSKKGNSQLHNKSSIGQNDLKKILFISSFLGILLISLSFFSGSNLIADSSIEENRINVSGQGPIIFIREVPFAAILLWYAYKEGKVNKMWVACLLSLVSLSLLTGNRSKMVMLALVLIGLIIQFKGFKFLLRHLPFMSLISIVVLYLGFSISFVRSNLLRNGGSFFDWFIMALQAKPSDVIDNLYRHSFNGFDGFLSIISNVPQKFDFQVGRFWYESLTILIPRAVWHEKWELPFTNIFTNIVWGWGKGGMFVTGPGVLYLDSGLFGVFFGGVAVGIILSLSLLFLKKLFSDERWIYNYCVACIAYFMCRFSFAGGSNDVVFLQRLLIIGGFIFVLTRIYIYIRSKYLKINTTISSKSERSVSL